MKKKIAVVFGGDSGEFDVSVRSGEVVLNHLDREQFDPYPILVRGGRFSYTAPSGIEFLVDKNDFTLDAGGSKVHFDAVFNAIHGTPGEDGKLQGYLEMLRIPVTSCDSGTSALTFNKFFCNRFVASLGQRVARSFLAGPDEDAATIDTERQVRYPVFVKPNRGGSSVGTSKVNNAGDLPKALADALREDSQALVEEFIPGREITCGVIPWKGKIIALPLTEIVSRKEFFDYEAKYLGMSEEITPAQIPEDIAGECANSSVMIYKEMNCRGIVRCDYIFNDAGLYFLEINTVPGLSEASIVPQQARETGISLKELFTEVLLDALTRR